MEILFGRGAAEQPDHGKFELINRGVTVGRCPKETGTHPDPVNQDTQNMGDPARILSVTEIPELMAQIAGDSGVAYGLHTLTHLIVRHLGR